MNSTSSIYKTYRDVRLVGTPPSAIGKFGGDTDNWMWPRHTGDFSMFRVYTGPDGEPADPSRGEHPVQAQVALPGQPARCAGRRFRHGHGLPREHRPFPEQPGREAGPGH